MLLRRRHVPQEEVFLADPGDEIPVSTTHPSPEAKARLRHDILQEEIALLRARLAIIRSRLGVVAKSGATWVHASARSQLGSYPWSKFAALTVASYVVTISLRKLPFGSITAAAIPLATGALKKRLRSARHT
jgi:hypothetical protein